MATAGKVFFKLIALTHTFILSSDPHRRMQWLAMWRDQGRRDGDEEGGRTRGDRREFVVYCALPCFCFLAFIFVSVSISDNQISLSLFIYIEISMTTLFFRSGARGGTMSAAASPAGEFCAVSGGSCFLLSKY